VFACAPKLLRSVGREHFVVEVGKSRFWTLITNYGHLRVGIPRWRLAATDAQTRHLYLWLYEWGETKQSCSLSTLYQWHCHTDYPTNVISRKRQAAR
jgi:hypothetical protein